MKKLVEWCSKNLLLLALAAATLGLAPFVPEPHIWEKLKWIAGGAEGMAWFDWFDVLLHGSPWVLLAIGLIGKLTLREEPK